MYLILHLKVCPHADQRLDDRQMTISACHVQRRKPSLLAASSGKNQNEGASAWPFRRIGVALTWESFLHCLLLPHTDLYRLRGPWAFKDQRQQMNS